LIHNPKARIVHTAHPSPLSASRGFFNSDCFKKVNQHLEESGLAPIDWQIIDN
jgi:uracil-DNA glycosylase